jgi:hypothetical protein
MQDCSLLNKRYRTRKYRNERQTKWKWEKKIEPKMNVTNIFFVLRVYWIAITNTQMFESQISIEFCNEVHLTIENVSFDLLDVDCFNRSAYCDMSHKTNWPFILPPATIFGSEGQNLKHIMSSGASSNSY